MDFQTRKQGLGPWALLTCGFMPEKLPHLVLFRCFSEPWQASQVSVCVSANKVGCPYFSVSQVSVCVAANKVGCPYFSTYQPSWRPKGQALCIHTSYIFLQAFFLHRVRDGHSTSRKRMLKAFVVRVPLTASTRPGYGRKGQKA